MILSKKTMKLVSIGLSLILLLVIVGCSKQAKITALSQLSDKEFAVPAGTIADDLVLSRFPNVKFQYYETVLDACMAVKAGEAVVAAYDEPILRNIAAKNDGLAVLSEMITVDHYGFAVQLGREDLKDAIDEVIAELKSSGKYDELLGRWLPDQGVPGDLPAIALAGNNGVLRFGTAAVTEPFSFVSEHQEIVGFDIELAMHIAQKLDMQLEIINMDFGALLPAVAAGTVDMVGACITISEERAESVLFSDSYYAGGIAALVKK